MRQEHIYNCIALYYNKLDNNDIFVSNESCPDNNTNETIDDTKCDTNENKTDSISPKKESLLSNIQENYMQEPEIESTFVIINPEENNDNFQDVAQGMSMDDTAQVKKRNVFKWISKQIC